MSLLTPIDIGWPPDYKIKKHRRAKSVKLRTSKQHGLEITIPYRFNQREIPDILEKHKTWIIAQLIESQQQLASANVLPEQIIFHANLQTWQIFYIPCNTRLKLLERPNKELALYGKQEIDNIKKLLTHWVRQQAHKFLLAQLESLSQQLQIPYQKIYVRNQQTRWGSCTSKATISLNYKLIFLPQHLVKHILIHELCHIRHLNHSARFWKLVAKYDVDWKKNAHEIKKADHYIPAWIA